MSQPKLFIDLPLESIPEYPGRKAANGAFQKILSNIPKCELFIDVMCGSGFIASQVKGCQLIINDRDRSVIDRLTYAAEDTEFRSEDYQDIINRFDNGSKSRVFYFDPPYLMETRSYQKPVYRYDWTAKDHNRFLKAVQAVKSPAMISHYPCQLYDNTLKKWRKITYRTMTRAGVRDESLYLNFPQPALLQCPRLVGAGFLDRQRIQRKVDRLLERLKKEPEEERAAILSCIIERFNYVISE
jgi:site-specific DNA-adenine methylase